MNEEKQINNNVNLDKKHEQATRSATLDETLQEQELNSIMKEKVSIKKNAQRWHMPDFG